MVIEGKATLFPAISDHKMLTPDGDHHGVLFFNTYAFISWSTYVLQRYHCLDITKANTHVAMSD